MYIDYSDWETFEYKISSLHLDVNNPRLKHLGTGMNQSQIIKALINREKVFDLAKSISEQGYFINEDPIICIENDKKVVLEGNRRVSALKILQDPNKYLSTGKARILKNNIAANKIEVDRRIKCFIAPNRILANPIIYERHRGVSLKRWQTGNQYTFISEMYYEDGLSVDDICELLNEPRGRIIQPLKAYNLFREGAEVLEKEDGTIIDIALFTFTNLERYMLYERGRKFLGIEFSNDDGELNIKLPREEFEKRIHELFKKLLDSDRFSREFDTEKEKAKFVEDLEQNPKFDMSIDLIDDDAPSKTSKEKSNLEEKKKEVTKRRKRKRKKAIQPLIIPDEVEIIFDHDKLDEMFIELKTLPINKKYAFAVLIRTFLEQTLYYFLKQNSLFDELNNKTKEEKIKNNSKKVDTLISYLKGKHKIKEDVNEEEILKILKFEGTKGYSNASLKPMLDYVINRQVVDNVDEATFQNLKQYVETVKKDLDLAVHNLENYVDIDANKRAWNTLYPLFVFLSDNIS